MILIDHGSADDSDESSDEDPNNRFDDDSNNLPIDPVSSPSPAARSRISIRLGEVTCCGEITPRCDVKTLRLGTRFHQRKEDNSRLGQTVVLFPYLPESGQSRCLSLNPLVVIG